MPLDHMSSIDALLNQENYENLVRIETQQTDSELQQIDEQKYTDLIKNHTDAGDPLISSEIDPQQILFHTATTLSLEEENIPNMLRTKTGEQHDATIQANAMKTWHRIIHFDIDPQKIRPFLAFRPIDTIIKTLANTTQHACLIIRDPLRKHVKARFSLLNSQRLSEKVSTDRLYSNAIDAAYGFTCDHVFYGMKTANINIYGH